ncbi:MAG: hypothetical protein ACREDR_24650, partial [Blastocatellia bacterium]
GFCPATGKVKSPIRVNDKNAWSTLDLRVRNKRIDLWLFRDIDPSFTKLKIGRYGNSHGDTYAQKRKSRSIK